MAWNAWVLGVVAVLVTLSATGQHVVRGQEWLNLAPGILIFIALWVLAFEGALSVWDHRRRRADLPGIGGRRFCFARGPREAAALIDHAQP